MYTEKELPDNEKTQNDNHISNSEMNNYSPTEIPIRHDMSRNGRNQPTEVNIVSSHSSVKNNLSGSTINSYNLISLISSSGESELYKCSDPNGEYYCIKIYFDSRHVRTDVRKKLLNFRHDNVLPLIDWGFWNNRIFEVFPLLIDSKSLYDIVKHKQIKNYNLKSLIKQTAEAIHALHKLGVVHEDIKPENLMVSSNGKLKVIDFGGSAYHNADNRTHVTVVVRTLDYASPEVRLGEFCGPASDFYSLGATIYFLQIGTPPFLGSDFEAIANTRIPYLDELEESYQHLLYGLMQCNKDKRWQYEAVIAWCNNSYAKWVIPISSASKTQTTVKYTIYYNRRYFEFEIPNQIPELVVTLAQQWNTFLINVNGQFEILADKIRNATEMANWEHIYEICNFTYEDMSRIYPKVYSNNSYVNKDVIYFIKLYELYPNMKEFGWNELFFKDLSALGEAMIEVLWSGEIKHVTSKSVKINNLFYFDGDNKEIENGKSKRITLKDIFQIVRYHLISHYYYVHGQTVLADKIYNYESAVDVENLTLQESLYRIAYTISGSTVLHINGERIENITMFQNKVNSIIAECSAINSNDPFINFCKSLCENGSLKPGFKVWAENQGFENAITDLEKNIGG